LDKATRDVLNSDPIAAELAHTVGYVATHRAFAMKVGGAVLAVLLIGGAFLYYRDRMAAERQGSLAVALRVRDGQVGTAPGPEDPRQYFNTLADKQAALRKSLLDVVGKYPGTNESSLAHYQLGVLSSDEGKSKEAEDQFKLAEADGSAEYKSAARWALQEIYAGDGRTKEAEAILRSFVSNPTDLVSMEQASIELAKLIAKTNPTEARALMEPLSRTDRASVKRYAQAVLLTLPGGITPPPAAPAKK
jgi:tetratricopeptide (TPR) repeat protein